MALVNDIPVAAPEKARLADSIKAAFAAPGPDSNGSSRRIRRIGVDIEPLDPLSWLASQPHKQKVYWSDRNADFATAGIGSAIRLQGTTPVNTVHLFDSIADYLDDNCPDLRFYGGMSFANTPPQEPEWQPFGTYCFTVPRFEVMIGKHGLSRFVCNVCVDPEQSPYEQSQELLAELDGIRILEDTNEFAMPRHISRCDRPGREGWDERVAQALELLRSGMLDKIVLARKSAFVFPSELNPWTILQQLKAGSHHCFHFCFQPDGGPAFIGASPERLYSRCGRDFRCEAIAGTRLRGDSPAHDVELANDLLESDKDKCEHRFVINRLHESLPVLCDSFTLDADVSVLKLSRVQHLFQACSGRLRDAVQDADIISALHPTPAVGGVPTAEAIQQIKQLEPFERGWYAGPVGWIGPDAADFAAAIRVALVNECELVVYSGAGIVDGSRPEREWLEIENKIENFISRR